MRIELVSMVPYNGQNLVTLDVQPEDEHGAQLVEQAKWRILRKLRGVMRDGGLVVVVCEHGDERSRKLVAALGLEVERRAMDEPAVGVAPAWLVTKVVGPVIPMLSEGEFGLVVVTSKPAFYAVKF
jgi:hypothetical protein